MECHIYYQLCGQNNGWKLYLIETITLMYPSPKIIEIISMKYMLKNELSQALAEDSGDDLNVWSKSVHAQCSCQQRLEEISKFSAGSF